MAFRHAPLPLSTLHPGPSALIRSFALRPHGNGRHVRTACPVHPRSIRFASTSTSTSSPPRPDTSPSRDVDDGKTDTAQRPLSQIASTKAEEATKHQHGHIPLPPPSTQAVHSSLGQTSFSPSPSNAPDALSSAYSPSSPPISSSSDADTTSPPRPRPSSSSSSQSQSRAGFTIPPHVQQRLSDWSASVSKHSRHVAQEAEKRFAELGTKVNEMTGYREVERLKALVFNKEDELQKLREAARSAKTAYEEAVSSRSSAQRDVNALLERKHSWTDADVSRFTSLVRQDHTSTHAVASTSIALKDAEMAVDKAFSELMQTILQRYHEEQVWSDKIRSTSTWANLLGLGLNLVVFLGAVVVVEPWKRRRLVERLEERMAGMMQRVEGRLEGVEGMLAPLTSTDPDRESAPEPRPPVDPVEPVENIQEDLDLTSTKPLDPVGIILSPDPRPSRTYPFVKTVIQGLPPYLDSVSMPSAERDLALAGVAGAVLGATFVGVVRIIGGR